MKQKKFRDVRRRKELYNKYGWIVWTLIASIICITVVWLAVSHIAEQAQENTQKPSKAEIFTATPLNITTDSPKYGFVTIYTEQGAEQYYGYIRNNTTGDVQDIKLYTYILPDGMSNDGRCEE